VNAVEGPHHPIFAVAVVSWSGHQDTSQSVFYTR
jgi:hypothetical protein